jgi:Protein of unknown function (DUF3040)
MSLPACQQRILDTIEHALQHGEPRLASMFAMFTRLNTNEGVPRTERLDARTRLSGRGTVLIPLVAMLVLSAVLLAMRAARPACQPSYAQHGAAAVHSHSQSCPSVSGFKGIGHSP